MTSTVHREQIASAVRAEVARQRVSQQTIAAATGLTQSAVSRRMTGVIDFSATELRQIAELLEVPAATLLGEDVA